MVNNIFDEIERRLGYKFKNRELLQRALTHSSYTNEHKHCESYERLEFLGDAALNYIVGLYLYETFPFYPEGELTKMRAELVNRRTIALATEAMGIMQFVRVGAGDTAANVRKSEKDNCDIFEAIVGAILIDSDKNLDAVKSFIFSKINFKIQTGEIKSKDYKSKVWECCAKKNSVPDIEVTRELHDKNKAFFEVALLIDKAIVCYGVGRNKKIATQNACKKYFLKIK